MKGIVLSGGSGSRWFPLTKGISKQLLPLYDKPLIYYSLSVLMYSEIKDILIITTRQDNENFRRLLGDGSQFGINLTYAIQESPDGIAQSFTIANECGFLENNEPCALVLGDNVFYGNGFKKKLKKAKENCEENNIATIFGIKVNSNDANKYGIVETDEKNKIISIEEKPLQPKSNIAVTGLYFYPSGIIDVAKSITPSARGELEITAVNEFYLKKDSLNIIMLEDFMWADCGTFDSLSEASNYVEAIEKRHGKQIACLEEIAFINGWITKDKLWEIGESMQKNDYGKYLMKIAYKRK